MKKKALSMISHLTLAGLGGNSGHFSCAPKKNSTSHLVEIFKQGGGRGEMRIMHPSKLSIPIFH